MGNQSVECGKWEILTCNPNAGAFATRSRVCAWERKGSVASLEHGVMYIAMYGQTVTSFGKTVCQDLGNAQTYLQRLLKKLLHY
jgi:hypothetical protein